MKTSLHHFVAVLTLTLGLSASAHAENYIGEVQFFANDFGAEDYLPADGRVLQVNDYPALMAIVGCEYGGDCRTTFALPNVAPMKDPQGHEVKAFMAMKNGMFPSGLAEKTFGETVLMAGNIDSRENPSLRRADDVVYKTLNGPDLVAYTVNNGTDKLCANGDYRSQVKLMATLKKYDDGISAKGQILPLRSNELLFTLLGYNYGGDNQNTFGIPNLSAATPDGVQAYLCNGGSYPTRP